MSLSGRRGWLALLVGFLSSGCSPALPFSPATVMPVEQVAVRPAAMMAMTWTGAAPTEAPIVTDTPRPEVTEVPTQVLVRTETPAPSHTPTATLPAPTETLTPTPSPTMISSPTWTVTPSVTWTLTATRTSTPTRTPTRTPLPTGPLTRIDTKFPSEAIGADERAIIYLPPGYQESPQRRYPVLYLLHGWGGYGGVMTEWELWGLKDAQELMTQKGQIQPMIIVQPYGYMPDGQPSYFFNHAPGTDGKRWGDLVSQDTVHYMDTHYRTLPGRKSRAIGGFSLGGQGALSLGLLHPDVFHVVGAHSPSFRGTDGSISFINDWNYFNQFDPIWLVQNTENARQLSIWLDVGLEDDKVRNCGKGSDRCVMAFEELLKARGIPHVWHGDWHGKHEGPTYWGPHIPDYMAWYSANLMGQ